MFKLSQTILRGLRTNYGQVVLVRFNNFTSSATVAEEKNIETNTFETTPTKNGRHSLKSHNRIVAAAFASLHAVDEKNAIKTPLTDVKISSAETVNDLLSISAGDGISRRTALKIVSILADWSAKGKVQLPEFEGDARFIKLCRILAKGSNTKINKNVTIQSEDMSTILGVTAEDEAAKLVASITLPQMVKVMSALTAKKRRSTMLLRSLSYNIAACTDQLNLKQCADLLYSMAVLNFIDDNLLYKVSGDICIAIEKNIKKSAAIGSIITSLGLLKFKNPELLDALSKWVFNNSDICRPQDINSLFLTLAILNYLPDKSESFFEKLVPKFSLTELKEQPIASINIIWSLMLLNKVTCEQVSNVLEKDFLVEVEGNKALTTSTKLKLLNIDAAAEYLLKDYKGPRLPNDFSIRSVQIARTKEKGEMVDSVIDSLRNLIQSESYLKTNINTGLGFFIDAQCLLDKKCNPLPLSQSSKLNADAVKIAVLVLDYHDMCIGKVEPHGLNVFISRLLEAQGHKILVVPYTEFKTKDKLIQRVQFLESKLKQIVNCPK